MAKKRRMGRAKGRKNKGFFFRTGRGWYTKPAGAKSAIPIRDANGNHIKSRDHEKEAELAYRAMTGQASHDATGSDDVLAVVCVKYLIHSKKNDQPETYRLRKRFLFDLCTGFPARYTNADPPFPESDRIHKGYGQVSVGKFTKAMLDEWIEAHTRWSTNKNPVQAIKRALNWAVDRGHISNNPIKGYETDPSRTRSTYWTEGQEKLIYEHACPELALAVRVMIATGARPFIEFAAIPDPTGAD